MIPEIDFAQINAAVVGAIAGASITAAVLVVMHRRRIQRRNAHRYEIPPFLRGTSDSAASAGSNVTPDWVEIHPAPKRAKRCPTYTT